MNRAAISLALLALMPVCASAHPDHAERLRDAQRRLAEPGLQAAGHLERGRVFESERAFGAALAEYVDAVSMDGRAALALAELSLRISMPAAALYHVDAYLEQYAGSARAFEVKATALLALDRTRDALAAYETAVVSQPSPSPDLLLARGRADARANGARAALASIDDAIERIGCTPVLVDAATDYALAAGLPTEALARIDRLLNTQHVGESWLLRRSEILEAAGRRDEARASVQQAVEHLAARSHARRDTRAARALAAQLREASLRLARD